LVTTRNTPWLGAVKPEAELIRGLLVEWGVPDTEMAARLDTVISDTPRISPVPAGNAHV
jgi:hypothetical protein